MKAIITLILLFPVFGFGGDLLSTLLTTPTQGVDVAGSVTQGLELGMQLRQQRLQYEQQQLEIETRQLELADKKFQRELDDAQLMDIVASGNADCESQCRQAWIRDELKPGVKASDCIERVCKPTR